MRIAGTAAWLAALLVGAGVLVGGWAMMSRVRRDALPPELRLPLEGPEPRQREPSRGPPLAHERSSELPPWFGDAAAPAVRIAGTVRGARYPTFVRLAIDVPEPAIWSGREVLVGADGTFDFGPMRRGKYLLVATGVGQGSRIARIDATARAAERTELVIAPCQRIRDELWLRAKDDIPAAGVAFAIAGRVVAITDDHGRIDVCAQHRDDLQIQEIGYVRSGWYPYRDYNGHRMLWPEYISTGTVLDADGSPARRVGVQPIWYAPTDMDRCQDGAIVVTTDDAGRFTVAGHSRMCGVRVFRGLQTFGLVNPEVRDNWRDSPQVLEVVPFHRGTVDLIVRLPRDGRTWEMPAGLPSGVIGAWVRGHVTRAGQPVPDARVALELPDEPDGHSRITYTHRDGSFALSIEHMYLRDGCTIDADARGLAGRIAIRGRPGWDDDVAIEIGAGLTVRGAVVDLHGHPVAGVRVALDEPASRAATPTDRDGRYALTLPRQGRYRLRVFDAHARELAPPPGRLPRAIDVDHPDGELRDVRVTIQRDAPGRFHYLRSPTGDVDLGAMLDDAGTIIRVDDEARMVGTQVGDRLTFSSSGRRIAFLSQGDEAPPRDAFFVRRGDRLSWQVERAGEALAFEAQAPALGSPPAFPAMLLE